MSVFGNGGHFLKFLNQPGQKNQLTHIRHAKAKDPGGCHRVETGLRQQLVLYGGYDLQN